MEFKGKTTVITGAASGIGMGLAKCAAKAGMNVVAADRDTDALNQLVGSLNTPALAVTLDVSNAAEVEDLAARSYQHFGQVDLVFNNAGIMKTGFVWDIEPEVWDAILGVNIKGVANGIRAFVPRMLKAGHGHIVNTSSVGGFAPGPLLGPYVATKFAIVAITETLQYELAMIGSPVRASLLAPGPVRTGLMRAPFGQTVRAENENLVGAIRQILVEQGADPEEFSAKVFDALSRDEFWIFPQPDAIDPVLAARTAMILERRAPGMDQSATAVPNE